MAARDRIAISLCVLCVVLAVAAAAAAPGASTGPANNGHHTGVYKVKLERDYTKGVKPFNGKGHKSPKKLPIDPHTGMVYTGQANRTATWLKLIREVRVKNESILVWTDRPVPAAVSKLLSTGDVDNSILNNTVIVTNNSANCNNKGGNNCKVEPMPAPEPVPVQPVPQKRTVEFARVISERVVEQGLRRDHVLELATVTGTCNVNATLSFTQDSTSFSLLFNNFNVQTGTDSNGVAVVQQSINCAFRIPIILPTGLTVAALASQLRGAAFSSPQGSAGIAWTSAIGVDVDPNVWAQIFTSDSYSARYWSGGARSGDDFRPITVAMELDMQDPTFSPCGSPCANCGGTYEVPVDFQFTLNAQRVSSETMSPNLAMSAVFLDSQDTVKSISMNQPYDFEEC